MAKNENKTVITSANVSGSNSETITSADVGTISAVAIVAPVTKASKGRTIMDECYAMPTVPARKDIIGRLVTEAGLTKAGAATYLQNYKTKKGLVAKKTSAPTA